MSTNGKPGREDWRETRDQGQARTTRPLGDGLGWCTQNQQKCLGYIQNLCFYLTNKPLGKVEFIKFHFIESLNPFCPQMSWQTLQSTVSQTVSEMSSAVASGQCVGGDMQSNREVIPVLPIRSEAEEEDSGRVRPVASARKPVLGSTPAHLSLSTTSSLSSTSTTSAARLVQSSLRDGVAPPQPPPRR